MKSNEQLMIEGVAEIVSTLQTFEAKHGEKALDHEVNVSRNMDDDLQWLWAVRFAKGQEFIDKYVPKKYQAFI